MFGLLMGAFSTCGPAAARARQMSSVRLCTGQAASSTTRSSLLDYLPSYAPDLNPDEYLNCDLKCEVAKPPIAARKAR